MEEDMEDMEVQDMMIYRIQKMVTVKHRNEILCKNFKRLKKLLMIYCFKIEINNQEFKIINREDRNWILITNGINCFKK